MHRALHMIGAAIRAFLMPRRAALRAELKAASLVKARHDDLKQHHTLRDDLKRTLAATSDDLDYWKIEAQEKELELKETRKALMNCQVELGAARVQIDQDAAIINKYHQRQLAEAVIDAVKTRTQVTNDDALRTILDHRSRED